MEILFLTYDINDTNSFYRSAGIIKDLQRKIDHNITALQWGQVELDWSFISRFDLIMLQRPCTKESLSLCKYIKGCNVKLWVDWDDDLFHVNRENKTFWLYGDPETQANMKQIISLADAVSVTTEYLKQVISNLNKNIFVIPNAFNDSIFVRPDVMPRQTNHLVWRGTDTHIKDLMTYGAEIDHVRESFKDWRFVFMGFDPWFLNEPFDWMYYPTQDTIAYYGSLLKMTPAAMHVPLNNNVFNRCKSNVAALEATFAGAVCIAPSWWNMPGTVPYSDQASYLEALRSVLTGEIDKVAHNLMAWEYIQDCLLLSKVNVQRIEVINSLL
jgi:hypothetical protein